MCLTSIYLRLSGMFPYYWEKDRYKFSFRSILLTCLHIGLYIFVNAKLILHDIEEYSQPVIYDNNIGIAGQFLLRILGVVITLIIYFRVIIGTTLCSNFLNFITNALQDLESIDSNVKPLYKQIFIFSFVQFLVIFFMAIWTLTDGIVFYEKLYNSPPTLVYFFIVIMTNIYKYCGLMHMICSLFIVYMIMNFLTKNLETKFINIKNKQKI